jgi:hypothetical protein
MGGGQEAEGESGMDACCSPVDGKDPSLTSLA